MNQCSSQNFPKKYFTSENLKLILMFKTWEQLIYFIAFEITVKEYNIYEIKMWNES